MPKNPDSSGKSIDVRPSSAVDFLEDDRRLHASEAHISHAVSRTYVGMYRAARKLQSLAVPAIGGEADLMDGVTGNFRDRETQERPINTRAFNLLIHTVIRTSVGPTRWSATVWAR